ncbi:MAG: hypothetical protein ACLS95_09195 [Clostridia bacterium]
MEFKCGNMTSLDYGLYIAFDVKTKEFVFIERESWDKGKGRTARVSMEQINVKE